MLFVHRSPIYNIKLFRLINLIPCNLYRSALFSEFIVADVTPRYAYEYMHRPRGITRPPKSNINVKAMKSGQRKNSL